MIVKTFVSH